MTYSLQGKNVLITGASRGLGRALAEKFWSCGANLFLVARTEAALRELKSALSQSSSQRVEISICDLTKPGAVADTVKHARKMWEQLDVLINNAAIVGPIGKPWESAPSEWRDTIQTNLMVPIELSLLCVSWMLERRHGKIIQLAGGGATSPRPNFSAYGTAKAGLVRFSETLAQEVQEFNIQVNCISPGMLKTRMLELVKEAGPDKAGKESYDGAIRALEQSDDGMTRATDLCLYLASDQADAMTGRLLSAVWDPWESLPEHLKELQDSDIYTLRRIVPQDRGKNWK